jgi:CRISPR-associated protein Csm5
MSVYTVTLHTLSPLHIGEGKELRQGFDFVVNNNRTYRLDEDAILLAKEARLQARRDGSYPLPGELLDPVDFQNLRLFRYILPGHPRSEKADARIQSIIKDVYDRSYIPGSSLKGAMRTALAWTGWTEVKPRLERSSIGRSRSWAGQPLERKIFGPDPNHDLLRALHVSDLSGPQKPGEGLVLVNAQVLTTRSQGSPIELEALAGDIAFQGSLTIDETLFSAMAEKELGFSNRRHWLDELLPRLQKHSLARITRLADWFDKAEGAQQVANFYHSLAQVRLGAGQALVQVGWGTGWDGKTFWTHLQRDPMLFEQLVSDFRMTKAGRSSPARNPGDAFPRSRRAAMTIKGGIPRAAAPFGWVLLEMKAQ